MGQATGYTAARMKAIEDASVVNGGIRPEDNHLILTRFDESEIDAGPLGQDPLRDTTANLAANNPVVAVGRIAIATDSTPRLFAFGDGVTAWNSLPKFQQQINPGRYADVYRNAALSIPNNTPTVVAWDGENADAFGIHAAGAFTVPATMDGQWELAFRIKFASGATGLREAWFSVNGVDDGFSFLRINAAATAPTYLSGCMPLRLTAGQIIRLVVNQSNGSAINLTGHCTFSWRGYL